MSELTPVLIPSEMDQLKWVNLTLNSQIMREKAANLEMQAEYLAMQASGLAGEIQQTLANGTADRYEPKIVEGQLQFHLKPTGE